MPTVSSPAFLEARPAGNGRPCAGHERAKYRAAELAASGGELEVVVVVQELGVDLDQGGDQSFPAL